MEMEKSISYWVVDNYIWKVQQKIIEKYGYTYDQSYNVVYPLSYYVNTGRASAEFLRNVQYVKPYVMARILAKKYENGTVDECIAAIKNKTEETVNRVLQKHV